MSDTFPNASLKRRFAAILYDFFLIFAFWAITLVVLQYALGTAANVDGQLPDKQPLATIWVQLICYTETLLFYLYFWRVKGQTLGMQVWKIRTVNETEELLSIRQAIVRFLAATLAMAPFGLGLFWALIDKDRRAAQDIWSHSRVVYLVDKPYTSERR
jgi:uncharacterized RDD family membrane protein YckC